MKWFKKKRPAPIEVEVPWGVEYRLRMLHMPTPQGDCTGCHETWDDCPTLRIMDDHWETA